MPEEKSFAVPPCPAGGTSHPKTSSTSMETTKDANKNKTQGVLGYRPPSSPADGAIGCDGYQRPTWSEEVQDVLAIILSWDNQ
ncbi:Hypothetical predicted protein [Pelobates cultripes]|uniref:Uncharacterized protein n=1 Tax=Pelobates cultripes TaxID=61616 RepID=A0AAD1VY07_PELCU|nr:Hypothetical predicted protein [Pelobates cultripes]